MPHELFVEVTYCQCAVVRPVFLEIPFVPFNMPNQLLAEAHERVLQWTLVTGVSDDNGLARANTEPLPSLPLYVAFLAKYGVTTTHLRVGMQVCESV